jgi:hypothetical protein
MSPEALLARLQRVRRNGRGWQALCPAHADRNPSLSICEVDGKILLCCFAGCTAEAICAALGIKLSNLFPERREPRRKKPPILRFVEEQLSGLRSRLTPRDRERSVIVVLATRKSADAAFARALALTVEGDLVQLAMKEGAE